MGTEGREVWLQSCYIAFAAAQRPGTRVHAEITGTHGSPLPTFSTIQSLARLRSPRERSPPENCWDCAVRSPD